MFSLAEIYVNPVKGFAFLQYGRAEDAANAIHAEHQSIFEGNNIGKGATRASHTDGARPIGYLFAKDTHVKGSPTRRSNCLCEHAKSAHQDKGQGRSWPL